MNKLDEPIRWLQTEAVALSFGSVMLSIVVHDGKIKRIEKSIIRKEQLEERNK